MIRNLKAFGLALCAVFAFSAVATSATSAQDKITTPGTTFLTGIQTGSASENVWGMKISAVQMSCTGSIYTGTTGVVATEVSVIPSFTGCTAFGAASPFDVEGCKFVMIGATDATKDTNGVANGSEATVRLDCEHTGKITITTVFGCRIILSDTSGAKTVNQNLLGVRYTNGQSPVGVWDFEVDVTMDNVHYTTDNCAGVGLPATGNDFYLTQKVTFKGYSDAAHIKQVSITQS